MKKCPFTKEEIKKIILELNKTKNRHQLAKELDRRPRAITLISTRLRKEGFNIPMGRKPTIHKRIIEELKNESKK